MTDMLFTLGGVALVSAISLLLGAVVSLWAVRS